MKILCLQLLGVLLADNLQLSLLSETDSAIKNHLLKVMALLVVAHLKWLIYVGIYMLGHLCLTWHHSAGNSNGIYLWGWLPLGLYHGSASPSAQFHCCPPIHTFWCQGQSLSQFFKRNILHMNLYLGTCCPGNPTHSTKTSVISQLHYLLYR